MTKLKLGINGAAGRMGVMLTELALKDPELELAALFERKDFDRIGMSVPGAGLLFSVMDSKLLSGLDVIVDFTGPSATLEMLRVNAAHKKPAALVIGTTGFDEAGKKAISDAAKAVPIVFAPNTSLGATLLFKLAELGARVLEGYDTEIMEIHHNQKKDAPSGTALKLAEMLNFRKDKKLVFGRDGITGPRKKDELGVMSLRLGDVVGEHTVYFSGNCERVEFVHRAHSRETFARGALIAAKWLSGKKPALYSMSDVLGL